MNHILDLGVVWVAQGAMRTLFWFVSDFAEACQEVLLALGVLLGWHQPAWGSA